MSPSSQTGAPSSAAAQPNHADSVRETQELLGRLTAAQALLSHVKTEFRGAPARTLYYWAGLLALVVAGLSFVGGKTSALHVVLGMLVIRWALAVVPCVRIVRARRAKRFVPMTGPLYILLAFLLLQLIDPMAPGLLHSLEVWQETHGAAPMPTWFGTAIMAIDKFMLAVAGVVASLEIVLACSFAMMTAESLRSLADCLRITVESTTKMAQSQNSLADAQAGLNQSLADALCRTMSEVADARSESPGPDKEGPTGT